MEWITHKTLTGGIMKKILMIALTLMLAALSACSSGGGGDESPIVELQVSSGDNISAKRVSGEISTVGEVDLYHLRAVETNRTLQIKCTSDTLRPNVDLLVHVFEKNANGELVMLAGNHAPVGNLGAVTVKVDVPVTEPKDLYIHVRDLMDDESSTNNPYYLIAYYEAAPDNNDSFETAVNLDIDGNAARDSIGSEMDADCFGIQVAQDGVYDIFVDFDRLTGSAVRLNFTIYDEDGNIVETRKQGNLRASHMVHYLETGNYTVVVSDDGKDYFDTSSLYDISVSSRNVSEAMENDIVNNQRNDAVLFSVNMFQNASIDYFEDRDVYQIDTDASGDIHLLDFDFSSDIPLTYRIELYTSSSVLTSSGLENAVPVFSHDYKGGDNGDGLFQVSMRLETTSTYFMVVKAASGASVSTSSPYTAHATLNAVTDADESFDHGNGDTGNDFDYTAIDLTSQPIHTGKIAFRGDKDFYKVTVPANSSAKQVLSLFLDIPATDQVQYALHIEGPGLGDTGKTVFNSSEDQRTQDLKTSFLVPESITDSVYVIKVYDFQDDNGEDATFQLSWNVVDIPGAPAACPKDGAATVYHNENDEDDFIKTLTIVYPDTKSGEFHVDTDAFDITDTVNAPRVGSDPVTINFPWVSGYIDYQKDEDWYTLDLSQPLDVSDTEWFYTISVELYANGSPVEYTWEFMPDSNGDSSVSTEWCEPTARYCNNGILAGNGDKTLSADLVNLALTSTGYNNGSLWIGKGSVTGSTWSGKVFFRISDFNYLRTGTYPNFTPNPLPDADWGYETPYYFRVTVKYYNTGLTPPSPN
jgi:hypothetical protein